MSWISCGRVEIELKSKLISWWNSAAEFNWTRRWRRFWTTAAAWQEVNAWVNENRCRLTASHRLTADEISPSSCLYKRRAALSVDSRRFIQFVHLASNQEQYRHEYRQREYDFSFNDRLDIYAIPHCNLLIISQQKKRYLYCWRCSCSSNPYAAFPWRKIKPLTI